MKVIILTRYNLKATFSQGNNFNPLDIEWLDHRNILFKKYCLPSVLSQCDDDFDWFLGFHPDTPEKYYEFIPKQFTILKSNSTENFLNDVKVKLKNRFNDNDFLLSMRLDNDDSISKDFVSVTKSFANSIIDQKQNLILPYGINYRKGIEYDTNNNISYLKDYPASSFVSLLESINLSNNFDYKTIAKFNHTTIYKEIPMVNITSREPMWMITIHDKNVGNKISGNKLDHNDHLTTRFSIA